MPSPVPAIADPRHYNDGRWCAVTNFVGPAARKEGGCRGCESCNPQDREAPVTILPVQPATTSLTERALRAAPPARAFRPLPHFSKESTASTGQAAVPDAEEQLLEMSKIRGPKFSTPLAFDTAEN